MSQANQPPGAVPGWTPPPAPKPKKPIWRRWWFIALVAIIVIGGIGQAFGGSGEPTTAAPASSPTAQSSTPEPSASPASEADELRASIEAKLGKGNRDVARVAEVRIDAKQRNVFVKWAANDNLSTGLIKTGMQTDTVDVLRVIVDSGINFKTIETRITFPLTDKKGNSTESVVVQADYSQAELADVNWENFLHTNVWDIADRSVVHPEIRNA